MAHLAEAHHAPYAVRSNGSGDRKHTEPDDPLRNPFERDQHRIIESTAFRRLEGKTQVFAPSHHDHFRTRLTHTLEAAQIARCLARALNANEQLAEAITLAHDLGHPPFGHAGEAALNEAMAGHGGFNHNTHALRVVDYLEHPFPTFRGLNLTQETRAGLLAHTTRYDTPGPMAQHSSDAGAGAADGPGPGEVGSRRQASNHEEPSSSRDSRDNLPAGPSVEARIASIADRIAYNCHDLEDAVGADFVDLDDLRQIDLWQNAFEKVAKESAVKHIHAIRRVVLDTMLDALLTDVVRESQELLAPFRSLDHVRQATHALVGPSAAVDTQMTELEQFLVERVYQRVEVAAMDARGRRMVTALFVAYSSNPHALPKRFASRVDDQGLDRVICDYIAGMTDSFCAQAHSSVSQP